MGLLNIIQRPLCWVLPHIWEENYATRPLSRRCLVCGRMQILQEGLDGQIRYVDEDKAYKPTEPEGLAELRKELAKLDAEQMELRNGTVLDNPVNREILRQNAERRGQVAVEIYELAMTEHNRPIRTERSKA